MRVAGYARVSTMEQALNGTSAEEQKIIIERKCNEQGNQLYKFYSDDGFSGRNDNRPGLQNLMCDAKDGKFDLVMFTKLDRLGRNLRDVKNILFQLKELSLKFYCVEQPVVNETSLYGDMMLNMLSAFSELESGLIRERTNNGRMTRWKRNESIMGSVPYGYTRDNKGKITIHPENRKHYEKIISLYFDQNYAMKDIAIKMKEDGIPSPGNSSTWYNATIRDILRNPAYTGEVYYNQFEFESRQSKSGKQYFTPIKKEKSHDHWISVKYPPLISKDRFDSIQSLIESKKKRPKKHHAGSEEKFMSENVLFCGYCGAKIKKTRTQINNFHYCCYWWETSEKERTISNHKKCSLHYVNADKVDEQIFYEIVNILSNPSEFAKAWNRDQGVDELKIKVERLRKRDNELKNKLKEGYKLITGTENAETKKIYTDLQSKDEVEHEGNLINLKNAENELNFVQNKVNRLKAFEEAFNSSNKRNKFSQYFSTKAKFAEFLYNIPFKEKKRLIEAVVSVETGGKCLIRHVTTSDIT
ncbi:MAG: putative DNA-invertase from lambdoid prophage Rac [Smithella sp. PtaU1.Bin162]|nr:MAG: putative DNA-invertase from lambdoid prophage Rac [Smithella sp. PtaU1.Bin162]